MGKLDLNDKEAVAHYIRMLMERCKALKSDNDALRKQVVGLRSSATASDIDTVKRIEGLVSSLNAANCQIRDLRNRIAEMEAEDEDNIELAEFGVYEPMYVFANASGYKDALRVCRDKQKVWVREFREELNESTWTVNGRRTEGRKMVGDVGRLLVRAYNDECDTLISKVTYRNIDATIDKIMSLAESISKFGRVLGIRIDIRYVRLKIEEARLAYDYAQFKEEERERIREERQREREERKAQAEIAAKRKELEREKKQYARAAESLRKQLAKVLENADDSVDIVAVKEKLSHVEEQLDNIDEALEDVDYREANKRAGYVYVISNVGSFGPKVYKIGMTRRLDPYERIRELSSASVPFSFDVHAMIFADDAPALEAALHREFANRRVNLVNGRKEFFSATLKEIESVILSNYDGTVEFIETVDADQWRQSRAMRHKSGNSIRLDLIPSEK